jgi:hypothetical protein
MVTFRKVRGWSQDHRCGELFVCRKVKPLGENMAKKPLFYEGMTRGARIRALFWVVILVAALAVFLIGGYLWPRSSSSTSRQQRAGESDYQYHQRLQAEDEEDHKDCGFKPTC